jgi:hypothetical protein
LRIILNNLYIDMLKYINWFHNVHYVLSKHQLIFNRCITFQGIISTKIMINIGFSTLTFFDLKLFEEAATNF